MATRQRSIASTQNVRRVLYTRLYIEQRGKKERKREGGVTRSRCIVFPYTYTVNARGLIKPCCIHIHTHTHTHSLSLSLSPRMHPGTKANAAHVTEKSARRIVVSTARKRSRVVSRIVFLLRATVSVAIRRKDRSFMTPCKTLRFLKLASLRHKRYQYQYARFRIAGTRCEIQGEIRCIE